MDQAECSGASAPADQPFMWGFSSSSYQYEDPASHEQDPMHFRTDWDLFYQRRGKPAPRGNGIYGWSHFDKEVEALLHLGATHYRFSVEWARVEPRPGVYNEAAIAEYVRRAQLLHSQGITPVVCLWHFTFPDWATDLERPGRHGWLNPLLARRWEAYIARMVNAFAGLVTLYAPQNEANNVARGAHLFGVFPPGQRFSRRNYARSMDQAAGFFCQAAARIRELNPSARILSIQNVFAWSDPAPLLGRYIHHFHFHHLDRIADCLDYLGFNYFTREPGSPLSALKMLLNAGKAGYTDLGWPIDAGGIYQVAKTLYARYRLPLIVTENGLADRGDSKRADFLRDHLRSLKRLEREGVPVHGYFHWSLADNYEWGVGFKAQFGLFSLCPEQRNLIPKPSAGVYRQIISQGWDAISP